MIFTSNYRLVKESFTNYANKFVAKDFEDIDFQRTSSTLRQVNI